MPSSEGPRMETGSIVLAPPMMDEMESLVALADAWSCIACKRAC